MRGMSIGRASTLLAALIFFLTLQVKVAYERHAGRQGDGVAGFMRELGFDNFGASMTSKDKTELFRLAIKLTHPSRLNPRQPAARKVILDAMDCCCCNGDFHACLLPHVCAPKRIVGSRGVIHPLN